MHIAHTDTRTTDQYRNQRRLDRYTTRLNEHIEPPRPTYPATPARWRAQLRSLIRTIRRSTS